MIGVAPTQFNRLEVGATNVSVVTLYKVSKALNVDLDLIVNGEKQDSKTAKPLVEKAQILEEHVTDEDRKLANHFFDLLLTKNKFKQMVAGLEIK